MTADAAIRALVILLVGIGASQLGVRALDRVLVGVQAGPGSRLTARMLGWVLGVVVGLAALQQLGFDLTVLLGAAGILSVAVGFAAQTSASNLISGLFLIVEHPFVPGDIIQVGTTKGTVESIDLLSVKLRTFDNLFVRLPNETLLKTEITNLSHYPIRRIDLPLRIPIDADLDAVNRVLIAVADTNPQALDEPAPLIMVGGFSDSAIDYTYCVWTTRENYLVTRTSVLADLKAALDRAGIAIPAQRRDVHVLSSRSEGLRPG